MSILSQLGTLDFREEEDPGEVIARLLLAAKEDRELGGQIRRLLSAPSVHRESLINTALYEMQMHRESRGRRAAFAVLATDDGAKAALAIL